MAEGVGFEPTKVSLAGFQDRCTRPLCEPSVGKLTFTYRGLQNPMNLERALGEFESVVMPSELPQ